MDPLRLIVGNPQDSHISFGPLEVRSLDFIDSPITINSPNGSWHLDGRNGIEPMALAQFRTDLGNLQDAGRGSVFFGDHDFNQIVDLKLRSNSVHVVANNAADDIFNIEIGEYPSSIIEDLVQQVDFIEQKLGPLVGYCTGCGPSRSGLYDKGRLVL